MRRRSGPEIIAGSTRLKAGTATKMVLNMLTTISMIKVGKTYGNLMVDVRTGSEKLKDRARRILGIVTGLDYDAADALLRRAKWNVKAAIVMQKAGLTLPQALKRLKKADDVSARCDRRGHRAAPPRAPRAQAGARPSLPAAEASSAIARLVRQLTCGCRVEDQVGVRVQLQERRRQLRRQRSIDHPAPCSLPCSRRARAARRLRA